MPHHALVVEMKMGELTIARLQIELDLSLCLGRTASNLGDLVFEAVGKSIRALVSAPVTGFLIGSPTLSINPATAYRPLRASTSTLKSILAKIGSWTFSRVEKNTANMVAIGSVS